MLKFSAFASIPLVLVLAGCDGGGGEAEEKALAERQAAAAGVDPDVPALKAGKWRVSTATARGPEFPAQTVCLSELDAAAKKGLGERAAELPCAPRDVRKEGDVVITEAVCNVGGTMRSINTRAYGDFNSDYFIDYMEGPDPAPADQPAEIQRKLHARHMGDC